MRLPNVGMLYPQREPEYAQRVGGVDERVAASAENAASSISIAVIADNKRFILFTSFVCLYSIIFHAFPSTVTGARIHPRKGPKNGPDMQKCRPFLLT